MYCKSRVLRLTSEILALRNKIGYIRIRTMSQGESADFKADLKKRLSPIQYHVTQEKGTERYLYQHL